MSGRKYLITRGRGAYDGCQPIIEDTVRADIGGHVEETHQPEQIGAGKVVVRVVTGLVLLIVAAAGITGLVTVIGDVGGVLRWIAGGAMGVAIAAFGAGYFRYLANPPPPDPEPMKVDPQLRLAYVCEMCGLRLAVVEVAKERAPRHCGEAMVLIKQEEA